MNERAHDARLVVAWVAGALALGVTVNAITYGFAYGSESGAISTYGHRDGYHGRLTANGERFNTYRTKDLTCAHRTLKFGTRVRVTNLRNGRAIVCRTNDRGPFIAGRIVDVSYAGAVKLGIGNSIAPGRLEVLQ